LHTHIHTTTTTLSASPAHPHHHHRRHTTTTATRFTLSAEEILAALASPEIETEPLPDVELPDHLVDPEELEAAMQVGAVGGVVWCVVLVAPPCQPAL
jgi:hypothetical protein